MRFSTIAGVFATCTTVLGGPIFQRDLPSLFNTSGNSTVAPWNTTNGTNGSNASNASNGTIPGLEDDYKLKVFITGGYYDISQNSSDFQDVEFTVISNTSSTLNITQLYSISSQVNDTLQDDSYYGVVVVANAASIESVSFFSSIIFDTDKTFVVSQDVLNGVWVALDENSAQRGPISVDYETGVVYTGITPTPVGILSEEEVAWFVDPSKQTLVGDYSEIRNNYPEFSEAPGSNSSAPVVPIIYDGDFSPDLIDSISSSLDGVIVVTSSLATNSSSSTLGSDTIPVVYAQAGTALSYVSYGDVPDSAIPAGYLTPVQAQLLVSIAILNNITDPSDLYYLFP